MLPNDSPNLAAARQELSDLLARLVAKRLIGITEAGELFKRWQSKVPDLPLDHEQFALSDAALEQAAFIIFSLNKRYRTGRKSFDEYREMLAAMQLRELLTLSEKSQDEYRRTAKRLAGLLSIAVITVGFWHAAMRRDVVMQLLQRALLGGAGNVRELDRVERVAAGELLSLQRFADTLALKKLRGLALDPAAILSRAALYAGIARREFYIQQELRPDPFVPTEDGMQVPAREPGVVAEYISQDDDGVCQPCCKAHHDAESNGGVNIGEVYITEPGCRPCEHGGVEMALHGYYLPGEGPFPGTVCWGRDRCRCKRVLRYLPDVYRELMRR